ncbi:MAG: CBS domain-containing protein [Bacillota bacterium]|nr:CBS domain-containing protein [Bacillota bacterium]
METNRFYLSRILGNKIYDKDNNVIGKLKDLGIINELSNPKVVAVKTKTNDGIKYLDWSNFTIEKRKGQYVLTCNKMAEANSDNVMFIRKHVLDQQIVDVNGRKVVRVNDISLAVSNSGIFVVAVDIGLEGLLRRIGLAKPIKAISSKLPSSLILWKDVEAVFSNNESIKLSKNYNKLSILHPADLADIIEDFDTNTGISILNSLGNDRAADVLEEMEEDAQVSVINGLSTDKAADILEEMPADEVADILDGLTDFKAEEILNSMEKEASDEVRELMEYDDNLIGSIMSTDFIFFNENCSVFEVINSLRELKPEEELSYSIYVVNGENKLKGTVSLMDLVLTEPNSSIKSIMKKNFIFMYDTEEVEDLIKTMFKYSLVSTPIVDEQKRLMGNVIINDVVYELMKNKRKIS